MATLGAVGEVVGNIPRMEFCCKPGCPPKDKKVWHTQVLAIIVLKHSTHSFLVLNYCFLLELSR